MEENRTMEASTEQACPGRTTDSEHGLPIFAP